MLPGFQRWFLISVAEKIFAVDIEVHNFRSSGFDHAGDWFVFMYNGVGGGILYPSCSVWQ
jgi:hypothetical protein